jgi:hypothetical protein
MLGAGSIPTYNPNGWFVARRGPVKPCKNVTFLLIIGPLEMLPGSAAGQAREPPGIESP